MIERIRRNQGDAGQAMVEFAIVLPLLCILVFGIIQFGILFHNYMTLTDAVRVGARQAAVSRTASDPAGTAKDRVVQAASDLDGFTTDNVSVTSTWATGDDVTVKATYPYEINLLGLTVASGDLSSQTTERVE